MLKKFMQISVFIIFLLFLYAKFFIYIDTQNKCYINIKPSILELSNLNVKRAINVLKYASPDDYKNLCKNVKTIDPNIACGGFGGGCYYQTDTKTISISISSLFY